MTYALVDVLGRVYTVSDSKFTEQEIRQAEKEAGRGLDQYQRD